ncbi:hypothetical protein [Bdellovibrio sp. HCB288]|uniref:hypothetical protein n=1 Tax=Bdellovibrio sp. HCB288 TaxID=3394355 RepID=UPI0039B6A9E9
MKSFKVFIATAVVTLSASISVASMSQNSQQYSACVNELARIGFTDIAQVQRSCFSGLREDGLGYAACMANMTIIGLPLGTSQLAPKQKGITAAEVCSAGTDSQFLNCAFNQVQQQGRTAEEAVRSCPNQFYRPQNMVTNGAEFSRKSDEVIVQESIDDLVNNYGGSRHSTYTAPRAQQPSQESQPTYEAQPASGTVYSDLPEVE